MKRSNRLVLLVGVFLAVVAFVGILLLASGSPARDRRQRRAATDHGPVVVATADIPLSTRIRADLVTTKIVISLTAQLPGAFTDPSQVVGQIARQPVGDGRPDHVRDPERRRQRHDHQRSRRRSG